MVMRRMRELKKNKLKKILELKENMLLKGQVVIWPLMTLTEQISQLNMCPQTNMVLKSWWLHLWNMNMMLIRRISSWNVL